jgi:hypothetical protein
MFSVGFAEAMPVRARLASASDGIAKLLIIRFSFNAKSRAALRETGILSRMLSLEPRFPLALPEASDELYE